MIPDPIDTFGPKHAGTQPFREAAHQWRDAGWLGSIPLPKGEKSPPPINYTGDRTTRILYPSDDQIAEWIESGTYNNGRNEVDNIGVVLGFTVTVDGTEYQIVGVDVDDYVSGNKVKIGGTQLKSLESQLGKLPDTVISSARSDGVSGIRFYRTPAFTAKGDRAEFVGSADKDIEVIQYKHRFAVVWPSIHPDGDTYHIYPPGQEPDGINFRDEIPDPTTLPELPDSWVGFLKDKTGSAIRAIDTESSPSELSDWANETFNAGDETSACRYMREVVAKWSGQITSEATSHPIVVQAHWEIVRLAGLDGCTGWHWADEEIKRVYIGDVTDRNKRSFGELKGELFRERTGAYRKVKAEIDLRASQGKPTTPSYCVHSPQMRQSLTMAGSNMTATQINTAAITPPVVIQAKWTDSGLADLVSSEVLQGRFLRVAGGNSWLQWDGTRWEDLGREDGPVVEAVRRYFLSQVADAAARAVNDPSVQDELDAWKRASSSARITAVLKLARNIGIVVRPTEVDADPYLLNTPTGTIDLQNGCELLPHDPAQKLSRLTNGTYYEPGDNRSLNLPRYGAKWEAFLTAIIPDPDTRRYLQKVMGMALVGTMQEKKLFILNGSGDNGKNVFWEAILFALGEADTGGYCLKSNIELLLKDGKDAGLLTMDLVKSRVAFISEMEKEHTLADSVVKNLTGDKMVKTRALYKDFSIHTQSATIVLITNKLPRFTGSDKGLFTDEGVEVVGASLPG